MALFNYVMRKVWLHQTRIGLSLYDVTGQGYLRESVNIILYFYTLIKIFTVLNFPYLINHYIMLNICFIIPCICIYIICIEQILFKIFVN